MLQQIIGLDIASREDLQVPCVAIKYEKSHTQDGVVWGTSETDIYPPASTGSEPRALVATIDLQGSAASYQTQSLGTEQIAPTSKTFWKDNIPALKGYLDANLAIEQATDDEDNLIPYIQKASDGTASTMPRYVVSGAVADWMTGVASEEVIVTAKITYNGATLTKFDGGVASVRLVGVDTSISNFEQLLSFDAEEETPSGLAQALYEALGVLHFEGSFSLAEEEVSGLAHPGQKLRLVGGSAPWATMDAVIQQVVENVDTGKTQIFFGPPSHLGPQDLVAQLRANRGARASWRRKERSTGRRTVSGGYSEGPQSTPKQNGSFAPAGGSGTADRTLLFDLTKPSGGAVPSYSSIAGDISSAYSAAGLSPAEGDWLICPEFVFKIVPASVAAGSWGGITSQSFRSFWLSGSQYRAVQMGPNGFWT